MIDDAVNEFNDKGFSFGDFEKITEKSNESGSVANVNKRSFIQSQNGQWKAFEPVLTL